MKTTVRYCKYITLVLFPLFFGVLLWLIYALNIIQNSNFDTDFLSTISFLKNFVAEEVAKSPAEWCRVAFTLIQEQRLIRQDNQYARGLPHIKSHIHHFRRLYPVP